VTKPSLDAVLMKIDRAAKHMNALEAEFAEFFKSDPYRITGHFEPDGPDSGWQTVEIDVKREPPPHWGVLVGDVVHNLSSALDHLMWQLARWNGKRPAKRSAFPAVERRLHIRDPEGVWPNILKRLDPKHRAMVEAAQPYHRWSRAQFHPLAAIRRLSNIDKHRYIHSTFAWWGEPEEQTGLFLTYEGVIDDEVIHVIFERAIEEAEIARFHLSELPHSPPYVKVETHLPIDIAFGDAKWAIKSEALSDLGKYVGGVYQLFEPDFRR
jgi:hypothetical protein